MSLKDIKENLYEPESHIEERGHEKSRFDPEVAKNQDESEFREEKEWPQPKTGLTDFQKKVIKYSAIGVGVVFALSFGITILYKIVKSSYENQKIAIEISGPEIVNSAQEYEYTVKFQNKNWLKFNNVEIFFDHSDNFKITDYGKLERVNSNSSKLSVGTLSAGKKGEFKVKGKFFAPVDYVVYMRVTAKYHPAVFSGRNFENGNQMPVTIKKSPIKMDLEAPIKAASGQVVEYYVNYENVSEDEYSDVELRLEYPEGFVFYQSDPPASQSNYIYKIGNLAPGQKGKIYIEGTLSGKPNDSKTIVAIAGSLNYENQFVEYLKQDKITMMTGSPLMVSHKLDNHDKSNISANISEPLYYRVKYKNLGGIGLRDVIITLDFKSEVINFNSFQLPSGSFSSQERKITWKAVDIPQLANLGPGEEGEINFTVKVKDKVDVANSDDMNFTIETVVNIDSPDIPTPVDSNKVISSDTMVIKLNSPVVFQSKLVHQDDKIENFGPMPQEVGKETSYVMIWKIINGTNDISGAKVTSSIPTYVKWKNVQYPDGEQLYFNERTHQIVWELGKIEHGAGIISDAREVRFQISFTPDTFHVNKRPVLINGAFLKGVDMFTEKDVDVRTAEKNIDLKDEGKLDNFDYGIKP